MTPTTKDQAKAASATDFTVDAVVNISLDNQDEIQVDQPKVKVRAGGQITFRIAAAEQRLKSFVILMLDETPLGSGRVCFGGVGSAAPERIDGAAHGNGQKTYSYCILATDGATSYHKDPDVIVGPQTTS